MFSQTHHKNQPAPRHLVLDIDGTLATGLQRADAKEIGYYRSAGLLTMVDATYPHILHPGVIEFMQYAAQNFESISFFSSAQKIRNAPFVDALLKLIFGSERYTAIKNKTNIYSRDDMVKSYKDLSILGANLSLDNTILIDDKTFMTPRKQTRNLLMTHGADEHDFLTLHFNIHNDRYFKNNISLDTLMRVNHLFYVTGLLKRLLESKSKSLADRLYAMQYQLTEDKTFEHNIDMHSDITIYQEGLAELRKINPQLTFFGGAEAEKMLGVTAQSAALASLPSSRGLGAS